MKKRLWSIGLCLCMILCMMPATSFASNTIANGMCGAALTWSMDEDGTLTISGTGYMCSDSHPEWHAVKCVQIQNGVKNIGDNAFENCTNLTSVTIPNSVTRIDYDAFSGCTGLTSITIPSSVLTIHSNAFSGSGLKNVTIPNSVTSIGSGTFWGCVNLERVILSKEITMIADQTFGGCSNLKSAALPDGVKEIGTSAFEGCKNLSMQVLPSKLECIKANAFRDCSSLTNIVMQEGLTEIGENAFENCTALNHVTIPKSAVQIGDTAFSNCGAELKADVTEGSHAEKHCIEHHIPYETNHIWGIQKIIKAATCAQEGEVVYTCTCVLCENVTKTEIVPKSTEHTPVTEPAIAATCTTAGKTAGKTCLVCGSVLEKSVVVPPLGHTKVIEEEIAATCTTNGITEGWYCGVCHDILKGRTIIPATGHSFTHYVYNNDAELGKDGTETAVCDHGCGLTNTRIKSGTALTKPTISFADVPAGAYYADAVQWAVEKEIAYGISSTRFAPNNVCTRAQIVSFLWRANGSPKPTASQNPFTDVPMGRYYTDAVLWAVEKGIAAGVGKTTFAPNAGCTRGQVVTFLWRANGKPQPSGTDNPFVDVPIGKYYTDAVLWAVENGITAGTSKTKFSPNATCTRGQIVTFLYRDMA